MRGKEAIGVQASTVRTADADMPAAVDVVVAGAGIIGAAIAKELSGKGLSVALIDVQEPGAGTSGKCDGNILVQTKLHEPELLVTRKSIARYREWAEELPGAIHFEQQGSMVFFTDEEQVRAGRERHALLQGLGVASELVTAEELREREPAVDGETLGGLDCLEDASVYPPFVVYGLVAAAVRNGAKLVSGARVKRVTTKSGRVTGVETTSGTIAARWVVNAMGIWAKDLEVDSEARIPIVPRQGVLLVTEERPGLIRRSITEGAYMTLRGKGTPADPRPKPVFVAEPTFRGNILIGSSRRFVGLDDSVEPQLLFDIAKRATMFVSELKNVRIIRSFAGLRPWTPDGYPLVGAVEDVDGYVLAAGHEGEGIALAPITADIVVQSILGGMRDPDLEHSRDLFNPMRMVQSEKVGAN